MTFFNTVLIANRGEIAVRLIRACRELGIAAVAVYSDADREALHVRMADAAYRIGPAPATESYLRVEAIIEAAQASGAEAVHPGYGFLSERAHFARACTDAGLVFIGPPAEAIDLLGSKIAAKRLAIAHSVPVVPGYEGDAQDDATLQREAERIGFPLLIKASAGGGGKGMRVVQDAAAFLGALEGARREARSAFGDDTVLLEKLIACPRHVEFQVLGDMAGQVVHLGERECSIQRRHQKIVEESPCVALDAELRAQMGAAAVRLAQAAGYRNAGTVEYMLDANGSFYFLEMNTRLQVEHPVTELVSGWDLVHLQLAIAAGQPIPFTQADIQQRGHAIEVRVYAEDPVSFLPATGPIVAVVVPDGPGVRNDGGLASGDEVSLYYDPMVAKLTVSGTTREQAVARLVRALDEYAVLGLTTNLPLLRAIAAHPAFAAGATHTSFLDDTGLTAGLSSSELPGEVLLAAVLSQTTAAPDADPFAVPWRSGSGARRLEFVYAGERHAVIVAGAAPRWSVKVRGERMEVEMVAHRPPLMVLRANTRQSRLFVAATGPDIFVQWQGAHYHLHCSAGLDVDALQLSTAGPHGNTSLAAPMSGTVVKVLVDQGAIVAAHAPLIVLEAMKMEHTIAAPYAGVVTRLPYQAGQLVTGGATLVDLDPLPENTLTTETQKR